jgi:TonB family protein
MDQKVVQKIGKYDILGELGQGGMGVVYKARDPLIGRLVALKTVTPELVSNPEILTRFYREAQAAGALQHPNIVTVFDLGEFEGHPYIAMEFVEGESLQSIIARQSKVPLAVKLKLAEQVCSGLDHAHKHGVVHRDVKPGNILVKNDGTVKVVDFGIVHLETTTLTKTGMFMGTIQYASPEQLNEGHVDGRSDLWSVTCVIYELIAYKKPFEGSNFGAIVAKILSSEPEPLSRCCPGVPAELDHVIAKGLKKNIEERYQSLDELLADLVPIGEKVQRSLIGDLLEEARQLKEKGDLNGAQEKVRAILILNRTHGEAKRLSAEITAELQPLSSTPKVRELVSAGQQAFSRGEYAAALRALEEALELNPNDTQARSLKERAAREQDRLRRVHEALAAGQKAMKQGDLTGAELELQKVLELDQNNPQASSLLTEIRRDRSAREKDFRLKEVLWKADNLVAEGKYPEAQLELAALQKEFPEAEEVRQKLSGVNKRLAEPAAAGGSPGAGAALDKAQWRDTQIAEATKFLAGNDVLRAIALLSNVQEEFPADAKVEALLQQAEQKKARAAAPPIKPAPPVRVRTEKPQRSVGMMLGGIALAIALGIGSFLYYQHAHPAGGTSASPEQIQLEHDAKLLQDNGNRDAALSKWRDLAARKGPLQYEAKGAVTQITRQQEIEKQEKSLFSLGMAAQQEKKWDDAVALYQKVADLNGPMKDQALQALDSVKELQSGQDASTLEKEKYNQAEAALEQENYARARVLFQQVLDLNVPGSTLAAKAQTQLATVTAIQQTKDKFAVAEKAQNSGDLNGALAGFQDIAAKPGPLQAQAQSRLQQINQIVAANQQKQQTEKALQDNLKKFQDLKSQKKYGEAAALLAPISQTGGDANQLKNELESAEQSEMQALTYQFNQAKNNKDITSLQRLKAQFQTLASASGVPASQARDYAENQIPSAINQINQANQPKPQPPAQATPAPSPAPAAPSAHAPVVTLIVSGTYRPWSRSVQKGQVVPDYSVEGGLKPLNLTLSPVQGAPSGSIVTLIINIDENGNVSPDRVTFDQSGVSSTVMEAAKKWKFNPPMVKGKPVKTSVTVKVTF